MGIDRGCGGGYSEVMPKALHTTNVRDTFIAVAPDCKAETGLVPEPRGGKPTVATLQYAMLAAAPYTLTSDDVIFATSAAGRALAAGAADAEREQARAAFFSKGQACMRASPLTKSHGWGVHADGEGRLALVARESARYRQLTGADSQLAQTQAMRSRKA